MKRKRKKKKVSICVRSFPQALSAECVMHLKPFTCYTTRYFGTFDSHNWVDTDNAIKKSWQFIL